MCLFNLAQDCVRVSKWASSVDRVAAPQAGETSPLTSPQLLVRLAQCKTNSTTLYMRPRAPFRRRSRAESGNPTLESEQLSLSQTGKVALFEITSSLQITQSTKMVERFAVQRSRFHLINTAGEMTSKFQNTRHASLLPEIRRIVPLRVRVRSQMKSSTCNS